MPFCVFLTDIRSQVHHQVYHHSELTCHLMVVTWVAEKVAKGIASWWYKMRHKICYRDSQLLVMPNWHVLPSIYKSPVCIISCLSIGIHDMQKEYDQYNTHTRASKTSWELTIRHHHNNWANTLLSWYAEVFRSEIASMGYISIISIRLGCRGKSLARGISGPVWGLNKAEWISCQWKNMSTHGCNSAGKND